MEKRTTPWYVLKNIEVAAKMIATMKSLRVKCCAGSAAMVSLKNQRETNAITTMNSSKRNMVQRGIKLPVILRTNLSILLIRSWILLIVGA